MESPKVSSPGFGNDSQTMCKHRKRMSAFGGYYHTGDIPYGYHPAFSLDLNPVEYVWSILGQIVASRQPLPTCLLELRKHSLMRSEIFPRSDR
ncbi:hypothetical protein TNCV_3017431 [Trichonephila clavipes]|nr:hypothetical protein TNCV_3017431 [Trichonephila clavipes]